MGEGRLPGSGWQDLALAPGLRQPRLRSGGIAVLLRAGLDPPAPLFSSGACSPHLTPLFTPLRCSILWGLPEERVNPRERRAEGLIVQGLTVTKASKLEF